MLQTNSNSIMNVFAMLGANMAFGNGFGASQTAAGGQASAFASLLGPQVAADGALGTSPLIETPGGKHKKMDSGLIICPQPLEDGLGSEDLLVSDLLAVDWSALQPGETINLAGNWTLTLQSNNMVVVENGNGAMLGPIGQDDLAALIARMQTRGMDMSAENLIAAAGDEQLTLEDQSADAGTQDRTDRASHVTNSERDGAPATDRRLNALAQFAATPANGNGHGAPQNNNAAGLGATGLAGAPQAGAAGVVAIDGGSDAFLNFYHQNHNGALSQDATPDSGIAFANSPAIRDLGIRATGNGMLTGSHPISQAQLNIVIQKMAERGGEKTLVVALDPAELGKVQVDLTSGRDKALRAVITVERPETLALLQKDLSQLETALKDAGLSLDEGSITLDLASQNQEGSGGFTEQLARDEWRERIAERGFSLRADDAGADVSTSAEGDLVLSNIDASVRRLVAMGVLNIKV